MEMQRNWLSILEDLGMSEVILENTQILSCSENEKHVLLRMLLLFLFPLSLPVNSFSAIYSLQ